MPTWIVFTTLATIAITAALTWVLWRINAPAPGASNRRDGGDDADIVATGGGGASKSHADTGDGDGDGSDSGGGK